MKYNILPENWCVARSSKAQDYLGDLFPEVAFHLHHETYFGIVNENGGKLKFRTEPFGQLLTEEQFLYCIGEPVEGEIIQVTNTENDFSGSYEMQVLLLTDDGAWCVGNSDKESATFFKHYRRKPLVFEADKWAKEKAASAKGKTVQVSKDGEKWVDCYKRVFFPDLFYRVKPEPVYTHFNYDDHAALLGKAVINKGGDKGAAIITHCTEFTLTAGETQLLYEDTFELLLFADGSPFGKQL